MIRRLMLTITFASTILIACAAKQDIIHSVPDALQCIESAFATALGTPDIGGLIAHCGATLADIEKVIADLENQDAGVADGAVSASPERAARIVMWKKAVADYKASHPNAK